MGVVVLHLVPLGQRKWALLLSSVLILVVILHFLRQSWLPALLLLLFGIVGINLSCLPLYLNGTGRSITDVFPFTFASIISIVWLRKDGQTKLIWVLTGGYLLAVILITPTWGGGGWGPRMLLGVYPLLAILGWEVVEVSKERLINLACLTLLASSIMIQLAGLRYLSTMQNQWTHLNAELISLEPNTVVTDVWWLPQIGAPTMDQIHWYGVNDEVDVKKIASLEECFWWIWINESKSGSEETSRHLASVLAETNLDRLEVRKLSSSGLEAIRYCVAR
jgi:hypothetical protein